MKALLAGVRWSHVGMGSLAVPVLTQMALSGATIVAPSMVAGRSDWLIAAWTVLWAGLAAIFVGLSVSTQDAARHGLLVGLVAALFDLALYGWFGIGALGLFVATVALGGLGGALARRERAAES